MVSARVGANTITWVVSAGVAAIAVAGRFSAEVVTNAVAEMVSARVGANTITWVVSAGVAATAVAGRFSAEVVTDSIAEVFFACEVAMPSPGQSPPGWSATPSPTTLVV